MRRRLLVMSIAAALVLVGAEVAVRIGEDRLPRRLEWHSHEAQRKVEQMDALAATGGVDVVVIGNSAANGIVPDAIAEVRPDLQTYNACLAAGIPRMMERWLLDAVLPRLHPRLVVVGLTSLDLAVDAPARRLFFDAYVASAAAREAAGTATPLERTDRWLADVSALWAHRADLRRPGTLLDAVRGTPPPLPEDLLHLGPDGRNAYYEDQRFEERDPSFNPAVADWALGTDDADAIRRLVDGARAQGAAVVLVSMPITDEYVALHPGGAADFDVFVTALRQLGTELAVPVLEHHDLRDHAWFADLIHLNVTGARAFSTLLAPELRVP